MKLYEMTAHELRDLLQSREIKPADITQSVLGRINEVEDKVKSYITVTEELANTLTHIAQQELDSGSHPDLLGIPAALKDNLCVLNTPTTAGSKILDKYEPPYDASVVKRLKEQFSVIIGKANLDEFAMGSSTENSAMFTTRNPWNLNFVPGGSSGGSAAAVAAGEAIFGLGSDTGGSVRLPASFCGVVGMKPTYGRVSRYGLIAYASSLDQIGPLTKDVTDCALVMNAICGIDPMDSTSYAIEPQDFTKSLTTDVKGLRIGVPREFFSQSADPAVLDVVKAAIKVLTDAGAVAEETSLPTLDYGLPAYYIIAPAEASSNLARFDGIRYGIRKIGDSHVGLIEQTREEGFGDEVKQRIMIGTYTLSAGYYDAYYLKAQKIRTLIRQDFDKQFEKFDLLATPVSPTTAFEIGSKLNDPLAMKLSDVCTITVNLAGIPAISVPCGFSKGFPIGLQLIGKSFDESTLLKTAFAYEQRTDWHQKRAVI